MSRAPTTATWRAVANEDAAAIAALAAEQPVDGIVFASAVLEAQAHDFDLALTGIWGGFDAEGRLRALATTNRTIDVHAPDPAGWDDLAAFVASRLPTAPVLMGPGQVVDHLVDRLAAPPGPMTSDERYVLGAMTLESCLGEPDLPGLRYAGPDDIREVAENAAAMIAFESGRDPRQDDADGFYRGIAWQILNQRYHVWEVDGAIVYQNVIGRWTPEHTLLEGGWTPPVHRGKGYGKRGLAGACRLCFGRSRVVLGATRTTNAVQLHIEAAIGFARIPQTQRGVVWTP